MQINRRQILASSAALSLGACTVNQVQTLAPSKPLLPGAPLKLSQARVIRITVCTRPFRPAGPRIEAEAFGDKTVIHNYGHGGSGWSLSWGCAEEAVTLARQTEAREFAVIGAGVIGLTTALRLAETGASVTIYAKELPRETRSARATGVWSPSSRIGLGPDVPTGFTDTWEAWARKAFRTHQHFIGSVGRPVEFQPNYSLPGGGGPPASRDFLHLDRRLRDIMPGSTMLADEAHAFPVKPVRAGLNMVFNVAAYTDRLVHDFLAMGGRMVRREFPDRSAALALSEPVILNCTGYGAKALWDAEDLVPVRGQINWLPPQPEARYGFFYKGVFVLSRGDGVVVQPVGPNDDFGYGDDSEIPDPELMRSAIAAVAPLFENWG